MVQGEHALQNTSPPQFLLGSGRRYCSWPQIDHGIQEHHPTHVWSRDAYICDTKHYANKNYPYHMSYLHKWSFPSMSLLSPSKRKEVPVLTPPSPHDSCISSYDDLSISCKQDDPRNTPPTNQSSNMDPSSIVTASMIPPEGYLSHGDLFL